MGARGGRADDAMVIWCRHRHRQPNRNRSWEQNFCGAQKQNKTQEEWAALSSAEWRGRGDGGGEQRDRDICKKSKKSCTKLGQRQTGLVRRPKTPDCRTGTAGREGGQPGRLAGEVGRQAREVGRPGRWTGRQAGNLGYAVACGSSSSGRQTSWAGALLQLLLPACCCCCCCCFPNSL